MKDLYISIDLGGTSLRAALLDSEGVILVQDRVSSELVRRGEDLIRVLHQEIEKLRNEARQRGSQILGTALGIPGLVDAKHGIVHQSPHFPLWRDLALTDALQNSFPFPLLMDNDANQAAQGEAWKGAGQTWPDFILMTLGTGIGGGIIQGGKIYHGPNGFAGEMGHIVIDRHGLPGALGSRGTLESLVSQSGLRLRLEKDPEHLIPGLDPKNSALPEQLFQFAKSGNPQALEIWRDFGSALACGIASLSNAFGFTRFVIGGGLLGAREFFWEACLQESASRSYETIAAQLEIVPAQLENDAGLTGGVKTLQNYLADFRPSP